MLKKLVLADSIVVRRQRGRSDRLRGPGPSLPLHDVAADERSEREMQGTKQAGNLTLGVGQAQWPASFFTQMIHDYRQI